MRAGSEAGCWRRRPLRRSARTASRQHPQAERNETSFAFLTISLRRKRPITRAGNKRSWSRSGVDPVREEVFAEAARMKAKGSVDSVEIGGVVESEQLQRRGSEWRLGQDRRHQAGHDARDHDWQRNQEAPNRHRPADRLLDLFERHPLATSERDSATSKIVSGHDREQTL